MNPGNKNIVILGGGYGGITAALRLSNLFRKNPDTKIHLIDRHPYHTLKTQLHEAAVHKNEVIIPIDRIIKGKGISFHRGIVKKIDLQNRRIILDNDNIEFDYLVIAIGSKSNFYSIKGLSEFSFPLQSYDDAQKIYNHISNLCSEAAAETDPERRREMLRFVVGGAGLAGIEFSSELRSHISSCILNFRIGENEPEIILIEAADKILPAQSAEIRNYIEDRLRKKKVKLLTNTKITGLTKNEISLSDGRTIKTRTVIWTGGIRISNLIKESGLSTGSFGRIIVDEFLTSKDFPNVYALGDNALAINPVTGLPVPAAAQFALQQGRLVAQNIFNEINGLPKTAYRPKVWGEFVSLGKHLAAGWIALPFSKKIGFIGFIANLLNTAIKEKHIFFLRKESRNWIYY